MFECIYTASDISTITVKVQGQIVIAYVRKTEGYISVYKGMTLAEYQAERGRLKAEAVNLNRLTGGVKMDYGVESDRGKLNNYRSSKAQQTTNNVKTKTKRPNPVTDTANTSKEVADIVRDDPNHKLHQANSEPVNEDSNPPEENVLSILLARETNSTEGDL